ncbi:MAG: phosphoenolpyruvate carboxylase [Kofleriaceae bacterium]|nr:phosphoenolpyruvate carboxylase [Kofleriaceae bacterium]MCB9574779.1 phosphoenolpyruvate carboxylase [Kofleriaceae bacterium]
MNLDDDLQRVGEALRGAIAEVSGPRALELIRGLGDDAKRLRDGTLDGGRRAFANKIAALRLAELQEAARAYTHWCHLMNVAEEQQRIRVLRDRGDGPDGLVAAVGKLAAAGASADDVRAFFARALVMPVLTAHPTEARRRSVLDHLIEVAAALDGRDRAGAAGRRHADARLVEVVLALIGTEPSRDRKPTPRDEIGATVDTFRRTLFDVTPRIYRTLEDACLRTWPALAAEGWRAPPFFIWGSWVGGDRDGNPFVTAHVTRSAFEHNRAAVLERYLDDVTQLGRFLSVSSLRTSPTAAGGLDALVASLERDRDRYPEVAARARPRAIREPWREKLWYVAHRLDATLGRTDDGYVDAGGYKRDLDLLDASLRGCGYARLADGLLRDCRRRVDVFGFHLASIDLRQHSGLHERVVDELLARGGKPGYAGLDEAGRRELLGGLLTRPVTPERHRQALSPEAQDLLATLDMVGRARHELGARAAERYVVSFTSNVSDLMEVAFLGRAAGMAPGELRPVPLLEQLEDLDRAGAIAEAAATLPAMRGELGGELEVMIGYSDSGKQVGYVTSAVALRRAQRSLAEVAAAHDLTLTVFHGRGGAIGRGGGPAGEAIRAQPEAAMRGRVRVTEQGETVTARYARPEIAERDIELTLSAVLLSAADERAGARDDAADEPLLERAAAAARAAYQALTTDQDRLARYTIAATPIREVAKLPLGSRPASRKKGLRLDDLRAIPWVFSWTQSRHGIPGWFGLGTALEALAAEVGVDGARALEARSRFFRAVVRNAELSLIRADIDVAAEYARLADPETGQLFELVRAEHARSVAALATVLGHQDPFADRPHLAASVARRNSYLDVLSHVQIETLGRLRARMEAEVVDDELERLQRTVFTTIGGIAAGLQTAG